MKTFFTTLLLTLVAKIFVCLAFSVVPRCSTERILAAADVHHSPLFMSAEDDDDDEEIQEAYGSRSLEWTKKYRRLLPYEKARQSVWDLGLRSKEEWDEYVADGKRYHGPYLPSHPDQMYKEEWVSFDEFLGITRPHNETMDIVQNILKLRDMDDYEAFVAADTKRARGLRIPAKPHIVYKKKGWISMDHFFGK